VQVIIFVAGDSEVVSNPPLTQTPKPLAIMPKYKKKDSATLDSYFCIFTVMQGQ